MNRSVFVFAITVVLVSAGYAAPLGRWVGSVGGEAPDTENVVSNSGTCLSQPGKTCGQKYNKCSTVGSLDKVCLPEAGSNGCGDPAVCQEHDNDKARDPAEQ